MEVNKVKEENMIFIENTTRATPGKNFLLRTILNLLPLNFETSWSK